MTLQEVIAKIKPLDQNAMDVAQKRWDSIAKPLHSLGKLETLLIQIAGITGNPDDAVKAFLAGTLKDNPDAKSDHHHGEHNHGHSENTHAEQPVFTPVK